MSLPDPLPIVPLAGPVRAVVRVPGSKSYSNRAVPIAALAHGRSRLTGLLASEDTELMMTCLGRLGIEVEHDPDGRTVCVHGSGGGIPERQAELFCGNSGTTIRFLTAMVALGHGTYRLDGTPRMRERPIGDLLAAMRTLGVDLSTPIRDGYPPVVVRAAGLAGGQVSIRGETSSQFLSALLQIGPLTQGPLTIDVEGPLVSSPYVDMTLETMRVFGASCERQGYSQFHFSGGSGYRGTDHAIEPDASSASYFFGAAAITGGSVTVERLGSSSLQGDLAFVRELERMGCRVEQSADRTTVIGGPLSGIETDLGSISDTLPTLAAVACFANSPTTIRGVAHVRVKESDRLAALAAEIRKTGAQVEEFPDGLRIEPGPIHGAIFETYDDHRMAMSLTLLGLRVPGIFIRNPSCTAKTYPDFFTDLAGLKAP